MPGNPITTHESRTVAARYPHERAADIAADLGIAVDRVYRIASRLGIKKTQAFFDSPLSGRTTGDRGLPGRFAKGGKPWNKGKEFRPGGRTAETQFRPGLQPHNTLPVGSYRICDGYLQRKISHASGSNSMRWRGVHELVWIEHNGPVPDGHFVGFKPGRKTAELSQITLDAVELRSRRDNMTRNSMYNYPQPIPQLIQLRGALQRKINRRRQHGQEQD